MTLIAVNQVSDKLDLVRPAVHESYRPTVRGARPKADNWLLSDAVNRQKTGLRSDYGTIPPSSGTPRVVEIRRRPTLSSMRSKRTQEHRIYHQTARRCRSSRSLRSLLAEWLVFQLSVLCCANHVLHFNRSAGLDDGQRRDSNTRVLTKDAPSRAPSSHPEPDSYSESNDKRKPSSGSRHG